MPLRQLIVWLRQLPDESATMRALTDDPDWTLTNHLLAAVVDTLTWANFQRTDGKGPKPKPLPRPGATAERNVRHHGRTHLSREEALAILRPNNGEAMTGGD